MSRARKRDASMTWFIILFLIACRRIAAERADLDKALMSENWNKSVDFFYLFFKSGHALIVGIRSVCLSV